MSLRPMSITWSGSTANRRLQRLYEGADLCVCDSRILRFLARLSGIKLPLVPGQRPCRRDAQTDSPKPGDTIAIVGGYAACPATNSHSKFPAINFVHHEPPMGLRARSRCHGARPRQFIASSNARFTLLAVGSPQQEMIASEVREQTGRRGIALCVGAGLDFITGEQKRAPKLIQRLGLEWAHRLASNPRRLWRRYLGRRRGIIPICVRSGAVAGIHGFRSRSPPAWG